MNTARWPHRVFVKPQGSGGPSRRARPRRAFTLLETILAIALSALLIGVIGAGMRIYSRVVSDRRADVVNAQVARVILQYIAQDLEAAYTLPSDDAASGSAATTTDDTGSDAGTGSSTDTSNASDDALDTTADLVTTAVQSKPGLYGNQFELQMDVLGRFANPIRFDSLTGNGIDAFSANLLSDPKVVTYYVRGADDSELAGTPLQSVQGSVGSKSILVRRVQSRATAAYESSSGIGGDFVLGEQLLSDQVVAIEFAYHDGYDWLDSWDSSLAGGLPIAVSITITVVDETATDETDLSGLTVDNVYQITVRIPTAELPVDDTSTTGI